MQPLFRIEGHDSLRWATIGDAQSGEPWAVPEPNVGLLGGFGLIGQQVSIHNLPHRC